MRAPAQPRRGTCPPARGRDAERCLSPVRSLERWELEAEASARRSLERRSAPTDAPTATWTGWHTVCALAILAAIVLSLLPL